MGDSMSNLENLSLVTTIFGDGLVIRDILLDWFRFLGGKPGEVVVIDCGSDAETHAITGSCIKKVGLTNYS